GANIRCEDDLTCSPEPHCPANSITLTGFTADWRGNAFRTPSPLGRMIRVSEESRWPLVGKWHICHVLSLSQLVRNTVSSRIVRAALLRERLQTRMGVPNATAPTEGR